LREYLDSAFLLSDTYISFQTGLNLNPVFNFYEGIFAVATGLILNLHQA